MRNWILAFLSLGIFSLSFGQGSGLSDISMNALANLDPNSPIYIVSSGGNIQGSQFKFDDWQTGRIRLKSIDAFSEEVDIMLDLENHAFYFRFKDQPDNIGQLAPKEIAGLMLMDKLDTLYYEVHNLNKRAHEGPNGDKFYQILYAGDMVLLYLEEKYLRKEEYIENLGLVRRPDVYKSRHEYFIIRDKRLFPVKRNLKSIEKVFPKDAQEIRNLAKQNDLKLNNDEDFAKLVSMIDQRNQNGLLKKKM